ncbi:unnamed protein product, partial [marine sediment metagenome]
IVQAGSVAQSLPRQDAVTKDAADEQFEDFTESDELDSFDDLDSLDELGLSEEGGST